MNTTKKQPVFRIYPKIRTTSNYDSNSRRDEYSIYQHLHIMHQKMQLVNSFVYMPMSQIPRLVVEHLFDGIQPVFCAVVNGRLVDTGQEALGRHILERAGVGKYNIHGMCPALLLNILLDRWSRLLVRPPIVSHTETVELIHAVSTANHTAPASSGGHASYR